MDSPDTPEGTQLLSVKETAKRLGIGRRTLERQVSSNNFPPPVKIGAKSLFFDSDVTAFLERLKAQRDLRGSFDRRSNA